MSISLTELLVPRMCVVCGEPTLMGVSLCAHCIGDFCRLMSEPCPACGRERSECVCNPGGKTGEFLFYYSSPVSKRVIAGVKHKRDSRSTAFLADIAYFSLKDGRRFDCVVYPPRSVKSIRKYGYDQARDLAEAIAERFGVKALPALIRKRTATEQKLLSRSQRIKNVAGMFTVDKSVLGECKKVLLVDDIYTTGATVKACASALRNAGVTYCRVFTLAKTARKKLKRETREQKTRKLLFRRKSK